MILALCYLRAGRSHGGRGRSEGQPDRDRAGVRGRQREGLAYRAGAGREGRLAHPLSRLHLDRRRGQRRRAPERRRHRGSDRGDAGGDHALEPGHLAARAAQHREEDISQCHRRGQGPADRRLRGATMNQGTMTRRAALRVLGLTAAAAGLRAGAPVAAAPSGEGKIGLAAEPNTFDPHLTVGRNTQIFIVNVYDGLTARDAQGHVVPALAESWKRLNPTTWQFALRKGVKFHNGDDFNAECVKFTLDRATHPETKATIGSELSTIAGTEIVDPFTVNVVTKTPDFLLPVRLGELFGLMLSPKHTSAMGKEAIAAKPNGTGPFKLVTWAKNEQMVLEANESYWRGAPKVKKIIVRPILDDAARIAALQAGEVDLIAPVPHARIAELKRNDKLVIKTIPAPRLFHVTIDVRKPPFDNVKVRQALNYGVDVSAIVKSLYFGYGTRLATVVDRGALGYDPSIPPYPFDPTNAKALLAQPALPT